MSLTQQQLEAFKGYRGDRRCQRCNWFGHMACHCQYKERMAKREQRGGLYRNRWNTLRTRVMGCEEDRKKVRSIRGEAQQGVRCWGCGKLGHCLWACPSRVAKRRGQHKEERKSVPETRGRRKVEREWKTKEKEAASRGQLVERNERGWIERRREEYLS